MLTAGRQRCKPRSKTGIRMRRQGVRPCQQDLKKMAREYTARWNRQPLPMESTL